MGGVHAHDSFCLDVILIHHAFLRTDIYADKRISIHSYRTFVLLMDRLLR